jgi:outer membrane protein OmpA-like peptidoglycan-associated protein
MLCALGSAASIGCKAGGEVKFGTPPPPPPPPPPPDQDGDGITDADDKCPTEKEDGLPPDAKDGCPDKDTDKDGVPVPQDQCPDKPETANGFEDEDGCPDEKPLVQLKETEVQINQKILFQKDKATIEPASEPIIDAVAELLKKNPELNLVEIGGHASAEGAEKYNEKLTQQRVDSVVKELIKKGVEKGRLVAQGYGSYCPIDAGTTEEANEKNRRVEFHILVRKDKDLGQARGCEAAAKKGLKLKPLPPPPKPAPADAKAPKPEEKKPAAEKAPAAPTEKAAAAPAMPGPAAPAMKEAPKPADKPAPASKPAASPSATAVPAPAAPTSPPSK